MRELLEQLCPLPGPSGHEDPVRDAIARIVGPLADEVRTDALGNLIVRKGSNGPRVMMAAHLDEVGFIVTHVDKDGFLRFGNIGGVRAVQMVGQRVQFLDGSTGVVGCEKVKDPKELQPEHLFIDSPVPHKVGDCCCTVGPTLFQGKTVTSKALDDRSGCCVLIEVLQRLCSEGFPQVEAYFVFTVQEELGLRGAQTAAFTIKPDVGIAVDVAPAGDTPNAKSTSLRLGKGVAIKVKDNSVITNLTVRRKLEELAQKQGIPYQLEVLERGGTDAGAIQLSAGGVPTGALSIPVRYVHSPSETVHLDDMEACVNLLAAFLKGV
ncbi:MAG: M42 family metallopeptidase [Bacillota bacterium]